MHAQGEILESLAAGTLCQYQYCQHSYGHHQRGFGSCASAASDYLCLAAANVTAEEARGFGGFCYGFVVSLGLFETRLLLEY